MLLTNTALAICCWAICLPNLCNSIGILSLELPCSYSNLTTGVIITEHTRFLFGVLNTPSYSIRNALTVDSAAMLGAEFFLVNNTTVPLLAILTIVHSSGVLKYYTVMGVF